MKTSFVKMLVAGALIVSGAMLRSPAQYVLSDTNYFQDFNAIEFGLPTGWDLYTGASATSAGSLVAWSLANSAPCSNSWSMTTGKFGNHASTISNYGTNFLGTEDAATQCAATNRAIGIRQTGAFGDPGAAFVFKIQDTLGFANFTLDLDMLMLSEQARTTVWTVDYGIGNPPAVFLPVGTHTNSGPFGATHRTFSFGGALDNQSQNVWIRIVALTSSTGSGNRDTFGIDNFSLTWTAATTTNPVSITSQPQSRTNNAGTTATFTVGATGTGPLYYQWRKDGSDLVDDGFHIVGANLPTLSISNVLAPDAGGYSVVVTNAVSTVTSVVATLTVIDPAVVSGPTPSSRTNMPGDTANFFATAAGTPPLSYQWIFNGTNLIAGATANALNVTNVQAADQGNYALVVSNPYGSTTSAVASLTVLPTPSTMLARWNFNDTNTLSALAPTPSFGSGTAAPTGLGLGGTNTYFASGTFSDPAGPPGANNSGWNTQFYPTNAAQFNKTVGVEFHVSTVGYQDILIAWEERHSATASRYQRFQYSTDGVNFVDGPVIAYTDPALAFWLYAVDLSGIPAVNNNPNFAWRIVTEFESTATGSGAAAYVGVTGTYGGGNSGGTIRYDLMTIYGNVLSAAPSPIPLVIQRVGDNVVLSWTNALFKLQAAGAVTGPYTNVPGALNTGYTNPITGSQKFFRLVYP